MFTDKLKKLINPEENQEGNNKKKIENLVFFVILLIITIVIINIVWNGKDNSAQKEEGTGTKQLATTQENSATQISTSTETDNGLEQKLEQILSRIQGVGEVEVLINYSESSEIVAMYNETSKVSTTEETDTSGGIRKIEETDTQKDIIYQEEDGEKTPITQKVIQPKIEGAIVTAKGAGDATTKTNIIQAVEAVTGLATHKIQVFVMGQ